MKFLHKINAYYLQMFAHFSYVALSFKIHAQERPIFLILGMLLVTMSFDFIRSRTAGKRKLSLSLASIATCNSIYLNMEAYGAYYWPFFLALLAALFANSYLRLARRPIFNPSLVGVFLIATVF